MAATDSARTAFVTGATGLLGQALCRRLAADGWQVGAVRRRSSDTSALADIDIDWYVADVVDRDALTAVMPEGAWVFHLAGLGLQQADAATVARVNGQGTKAVLDAAIANDAARFLFVSTAGTRGREGGVADEDDIVTPVGAYQESKRAGELLVAEAVANGLDAVVVHPTSVFAPGDAKFTERLVSLTRSPLPLSLPGGASFVGVDDVVSGMLAAMERGEPGEHYLLGGENYSYREALAILAREGRGRAPLATVPPALIHLAGRVVGPVNALLGTRLFPFDAAMARLTTRKLFYSSEKARADLGYEPTPFRDLVPAVMEWYDAAQRAGGRADPRVARRRSGATVAQGQRAATVAARSNAPVETSAVDTSSVEAEAPHGETPVVTAAHDDPVDQTEPVV